jgi:hypothetical protein
MLAEIPALQWGSVGWLVALLHEAVPVMIQLTRRTVPSQAPAVEIGWARPKTHVAVRIPKPAEIGAGISQELLAKPRAVNVHGPKNK